MWSILRHWFGGKKRVRVRQNRQRIVLSVENAPLVYAIGDLHGSLDLLLDAEDRIRFDVRRFDLPALVLLLGDLVDRGPRSAQVIDHILASKSAEFDRIAICGNHDAAFLDFLRNPKQNLAWLNYGGSETLRSYGIEAKYMLSEGGGLDALVRAARETVPAEHVSFLREMPVSLQVGDVLYVHAGIFPGRPLSEQRDADFLWIRQPFLELGPQLPLIVVHGHTPQTEPSFHQGRIGIDTGAYATGRLTVLRNWQGHLELLA